MTIRNIVVTGANSGIGFETALHFARIGDHVILACRNLDKADRAQSLIRAEVPGANLTIFKLDVSDLESVRTFVHQFVEKIGELDLLINNAGIVAIPLQRNSAGHELQLATNYLGAFALTGLLLPIFCRTRPGRIVNVGSLIHRLGKFEVEDLNWEKADYKQWKAYSNSKIALLSFTLELNQPLQHSGSNIIALAAHPGFANTNINEGSPMLSPTHPVLKWIQNIMKAFVPSAASSARSIILAAEGDDVSGGEYYGPGGFLEIAGKPAKANINADAKNGHLAKKLWTLTESMTGVSFLSD